MQRACPSVRLSVRLFVCLLPNCKNAIFSKSKQFRAMVSINDLQKIKMAEIRHLENQRDLNKISQTGAE